MVSKASCLLLVCSVWVAQAHGPIVLPLSRIRPAPSLHRPNLGVTRGKKVPQVGSLGKNGEYFVTLSVGGKPFQLQLDTGSSDLALPTKLARKKHDQDDQMYDPSKSSSAEPIPCKPTQGDVKCPDCHNKICSYQISYADKSGYKAQVYNDTVSFGPGLSATALVGAMYNESQDFQANASQGIVGFGRPTDSQTESPTIFDRLVASGAVEEDAFAFCYHDVGGVLWLGMPDKSLLKSMTWTPLLKGNLYPVKMLDIQVDGKSIGVKASVYNSGDDGCIVDTGTTAVVLPTSAFKGLTKTMEGFCKTTKLEGVCNGNKTSGGLFYGSCWALSKKDIAKFPTISLVIDGFTVAFSPAEYLRNDPAFCNNGLYSLIFDDEGDDDGTILGDVLLQKYLTVVDRANKKVGFAEISDAKCSASMAATEIVVV